MVKKKLLVKQILETATNFKWSLQGLGMLRLYLSDEVRLHIWDSRYRVDSVSPLHTHPWGFQSQVVAGVVRQIRYTLSENQYGTEYSRTLIKCGPGGGPKDEVDKVRLFASTMEMYSEGQEYFQAASEIHESFPENGTVTIITRKFEADADHAYVLWLGNGGFVSAEPRPATEREVSDITTNALQRWF
jgi:hypothetical protein